MSMYPNGRERDDDDPGRLRSDEDYERPEPPTCDECLRPINVGIVSLQGVGLFCSHKCANRGALKHEAAMQGRTA